jgi:hypothetical protein
LHDDSADLSADLLPELSQCSSSVDLRFPAPRFRPLLHHPPTPPFFGAIEKEART